MNINHSSLIVVVDADAIIAQAMGGDVHHDRAIAISQILSKLRVKPVYPATAIVEAVTALQRKFSNPDLAAKTLTTFNDVGVFVESINQDMLMEARSLFNPRGSKHNTLFDAVVMVVARRYKAAAIFSFDKFYKTQGFTLASEL